MDITDLKHMQNQLHDAATTDALTGIYNRRHLDEHVHEVVNYAERYGTPLSICPCDIDHFKTVNDTYGHNKGDEVLQRFAEILTDEIRTPNFAGRLGGDEF